MFQMIRDRPSAADYRAYIGSPDIYDLLSASHFRLLTSLGLRQHHYLLDIGAGSLRVGRLLIPYLLAGRYFAIEPNEWLIEAGIENECGRDLVNMKRPAFACVADFSCSRFGREFDFILAHSVFSHASLPQIRAALAEARRCMGPQSLFLATYKKSDRDYDGADWVYPDLTHYRCDTMIAAAQQCDLRCIEIPFDTLIGQTWCVFTLPEVTQDVAEAVDRVSRPCNCAADVKAWKDRHESLAAHPWVRFGRYLNQTIHRLAGR